MPDELDRIELTRTGGFANIPVGAAISGDALAPHERAGVDALLERQPAEASATPGAPDRFQYDLTIVCGDRHHHVRLGEHEIDERVRPLIDRIERDATPQRPTQ